MHTFKQFSLIVTEQPTDRPIGSPAEAAEFMQKYIGQNAFESFLVVPLDGRARPTGFYVVSQGTLTQSIVHPREVFQIAIREGAASILLIHNHPSGIGRPSTEDDEVTTRLAEAGRMLGIKVLDHLIVCEGEVFSYATDAFQFLDA